METTRFELVTPCMSSKYSNQLSYASEVFQPTGIIITQLFGKSKSFFKIS